LETAYFDHLKNDARNERVEIFKNQRSMKTCTIRKLFSENPTVDPAKKNPSTNNKKILCKKIEIQCLTYVCSCRQEKASFLGENFSPKENTNNNMNRKKYI
jgi:hypothetical protein